MEFTACILNVRVRQMTDIKKTEQKDDLDALITFLEEQGIRGNMSTHGDDMLEVPEHIRKIMQEPQR